MLLNDLDAMNAYMNEVTSEMFSFFDTGKNPNIRICILWEASADWHGIGN